MLATLGGTAFDADAVDLAVAVAVERAAPLIVVDVRACPVGGRGARPDLRDAPDHAASLRSPLERATAAGVAVEDVRVRALRPTAALLGIVGEHRPALLVFGPDARRLSRLHRLSPRRYRHCLRALTTRTSCQLWTPAPEPVAAPTRRTRALSALVAAACAWPSPPARVW
jgi:nucleotide-binding universal stress UspA family protein